VKQINRPSKNTRAIYAYAPVIISCIISLSLLYSGWTEKLENLIHENESALTRARYPSDIVMVELDHASLEKLDSWPWPRRYYAKAIDELLQAKAKRVFIDIDFSAYSNVTEDDILADTLKKTRPGSVLMPTFLQYSNSGDNKFLTLNKPNSKFIKYVTPVSVNVTPDSDGLVRRITILPEFAGRSIPTASVIYNNYPAKANESMRLDFRIMPDSFKRISFSEVYAGNFDHEAVKDKFIIIGASALELSDQIAVPVYTTLAGPVVQAISIQTLANGGLTIVGRSVTALAIVILCYPAWLVFNVPGWRNGLWRLTMATISVLLVSLVAHAGFNVLLNIVPIVLFAIISYIFFLFSKIDRQIYRIFLQSIALSDKETMMTHVIKNTSEGIILLNDRLVVTTSNAAACRIFHNTNNEIIGKPVSLLLPDIDLISEADKARGQIETQAVQQDGNRLPVAITLNKVNTNKELIYTIFIHDISEQKKQQDELTYQATHDSLTDLNNRAFLLSMIDIAINDYQVNEHSFILILIDLNNFKSVNDALGHGTGDRLLIMLAQRFKTLLDDDTYVARLGGDEFGILTRRSSSRSELNAYIERVEEMISEPIELSGMSLTLDAAIGIACIPEHATTSNELMVAADIAMYKSKHTQKGFSVYDSEAEYHTKRNLTISNDIKQAILLDQLTLKYQPKIDLHTNLVAGFEALIRWHHPELGVISPNEFIPIIENSSLTKPVTMFAIEAAARKQRELKQAGFEVSISVNISATLFDDNSLASDIGTILSNNDVPPSAITLEITESAAMSEQKQTLIILYNFIQNNFRVSIDDFGTSNASFSYLKQLPATELKIDKLFVTNICRDNSDKIITASIIALAHGLNMQVVAEGVEDHASFEYLKSLGCDYAQGYWISRALSDEDVIPWIADWEISKHIKQQKT